MERQTEKKALDLIEGETVNLRWALESETSNLDQLNVRFLLSCNVYSGRFVILKILLFRFEIKPEEILSLISPLCRVQCWVILPWYPISLPRFNPFECMDMSDVTRGKRFYKEGFPWCWKPETDLVLAAGTTRTSGPNSSRAGDIYIYIYIYTKKKLFLKDATQVLQSGISKRTCRNSSFSMISVFCKKLTFSLTTFTNTLCDFHHYTKKG